MKVADILKAKGAKVATVRPTDTIHTLTLRLRFEGIGALVVSSDGDKLEGIVSERDVAHGLAEHKAKLLEMNVASIMTSSVTTCSPDDAIADVARIMTNRRVRHIPVQQKGKLVGLISIGDVVKHRIDEMQLEANVLRDYAIARQ